MNKQRIPPVDTANASGTNKNFDTLNFAFGFMPNMPLAVARSQPVLGGVIRTRHSGAISSSRSAMHENLVFDFRTMRILPIACLMAFTGCAAIEGVAENHRVTANLATYIEEDHEKTENARVRVGQPYDQGLPELAQD